MVSPSSEKKFWATQMYWHKVNSFNTNLPMKSGTGKLNTSCFSTTLCNWILDFLTNRPHRVQIGGHTSSTFVLNNEAPQGYVLSPTTIIGRIINNNKRFISRRNQQSCRVVHREQSTAQCQQNQGADCWFQKEGGKDTHLVYISGAEVQQVNSSWFLGINTENLSSSNITTLV